MSSVTTTEGSWLECTRAKRTWRRRCKGTTCPTALNISCSVVVIVYCITFCSFVSLISWIRDPKNNTKYYQKYEQYRTENYEHNCFVFAFSRSLLRQTFWTNQLAVVSPRGDNSGSHFNIAESIVIVVMIEVMGVLSSSSIRNSLNFWSPVCLAHRPLTSIILLLVAGTRHETDCVVTSVLSCVVAFRKIALFLGISCAHSVWL